MERRLMGEELERGLSNIKSSVGVIGHPSYYLLEHLQDCGIKFVAVKRVADDFSGVSSADPKWIDYWLENGAKLYIDTGDHPEYATPECQSAYEVVVHDKAAEVILRNLVLLSRDKMKASLIKNNVCYSQGLEAADVLNGETSWGLHENYLVSSDISPFIFR